MADNGIYLYNKLKGNVEYKSADEYKQLLTSGKDEYVDVYPVVEDGNLIYASPAYILRNKDKLQTPEGIDNLFKFLNPDEGDVPIIEPKEYKQLLLKPNKTPSENRALLNYAYRTGGTSNIPQTPTLKQPVSQNIAEIPQQKTQNTEQPKAEEPTADELKSLKDHVIMNVVDIKNYTEKKAKETPAPTPSFSPYGATLLEGNYNPDKVYYDLANEMSKNLIEDLVGGKSLAQFTKYKEDILTAGLASLQKTGALFSLANKLKNNEPLTDAEQQFYKVFALSKLAEEKNLLNPKSTVGRIANVVGQSLPFIEEFILTGMASAPLRKGTEYTIRKLITKGAEKEIAEKTLGEQLLKQAAPTVTSKLINAAPKIAGVATAAAQQTAMSPSTYENIGERYLQTGNLGESIRKGVASSYGNIVTEYIGEFLPPLTKVVDKLPLGKAKTFVGNILSLPEKMPLAKYAQMQNILAENIEELAGGLWDVGVTGDYSFKDFVKSIPDIAYDTSASTAVYGLFGIPTMHIQNKARENFKLAYDQFDKSDIDPETKNLINDVLFNSNSAEEISKKLSDVKLGKKQTPIAINYINAYIKNKIVNGIDDEVRINSQKLANKQTGNIVIGEDYYGDKWFILDQTDTDGMFVAKNKETGEIKMLNPKTIANVEHVDFEDFVKSVSDAKNQEETQLLNQKLSDGSIYIGKKFNLNGKPFVVDNVENGRVYLFDEENAQISEMPLDDFVNEVIKPIETNQQPEQPQAQEQMQTAEQQPAQQQQTQVAPEMQQQEQAQQQEQVQDNAQQQVTGEINIGNKKYQYTQTPEGAFVISNVQAKDAKKIATELNIDEDNFDVQYNEITEKPTPFSKSVVTGYDIVITPKKTENVNVTPIEIDGVTYNIKQINDNEFRAENINEADLQKFIDTIDTEKYDYTVEPIQTTTAPFVKKTQPKQYNIRIVPKALQQEETQVQTNEQPQEQLVTPQIQEVQEQAQIPTEATQEQTTTNVVPEATQIEQQTAQGQPVQQEQQIAQQQPIQEQQAVQEQQVKEQPVVQETTAKNKRGRKPKITQNKEEQNYAEAVRSNEGQILQGEPQNNVVEEGSLRQSTGESSENLQFTAPEQPVETRTEQQTATQEVEQQTQEQVSSPILTEDETVALLNDNVKPDEELIAEFEQIDNLDDLQSFVERNKEKLANLIENFNEIVKLIDNVKDIDEANKIMKEFKAKFPNSSNVVFLKSEEELKQLLGIQDDQNEIIEVYDKRTNTIYIAGIPKRELLTEIFLHANVAHGGLQTLFENETELNNFYKFVYGLVGEEGFKNLCDSIDREREQPVGSTYRAYADADEVTKGAEYVAFLAYKERNKLLNVSDKSLLQQIIDYIKEYLNKILGTNNLQDDFIVDVLKLSMFNISANISQIDKSAILKYIGDKTNEKVLDIIEGKETDVDILNNYKDVLFMKIDPNNIKPTNLTREEKISKLEDAGYFLTPDEFEDWLKNTTDRELQIEIMQSITLITDDGKFFISYDKNRFGDYKQATAKTLELSFFLYGHNRLASNVFGITSINQISHEGFFRTSYGTGCIVNMYTMPETAQIEAMKRYFNMVFDYKFTELDARPAIEGLNRVLETRIFSIKSKDEIQQRINEAIDFNNGGYYNPMWEFLHIKRSKNPVEEEVKRNWFKLFTNKLTAGFIDRLQNFKNFVKENNLKTNSKTDIDRIATTWESAAQYKVEQFQKNEFKAFIDNVKLLLKKYNKKDSYDLIKEFNDNYKKLFINLETKLRNGEITENKYKQEYDKLLDKYYTSLIDNYGDDVGLYLLAKHALERNKSLYIEQELEERGIDINDPNFETLYKELEKTLPIPEDINYSGLDNKHAKLIVDKFENSIEEEDLNNLWESVRGVSNIILNKYIERGLTKDIPKIVQLRNWQHYVPLTFWATTEADDLFTYGSHAQYHPQKVKTKGRQSLPENPIVTLYERSAISIIYTEKEKLRQALIKLAMMNTDKRDKISVDRVYTYTDDAGNIFDVVINTKGEVYRYNMSPNGDVDLVYIGQKKDFDGRFKQYNAVKTNPYVTDGVLNFTTYLNGQKYVVTISDPVAAGELKGLFDVSIENMPVLNQLSRATRAIASAHTAFSLSFVIRNPFRDVQSYIAYNYITGGLSMLGKSIQSLTYVPRKILGDEKSLQYYKEFRENGGKTDRIAMFNIEKAYKIKDKLLNSKLTTKNALLYLSGVGVIRDAFKFIKYINENIEISLRFAEYVAQRERGNNIENSIKHAKEVTVNFNRRGYYTSAVGSIILFFNPQMQSLGQHIEFVKNKETRLRYFTTVASYFAFGIVSRMLYEAMKDDDDKGVKNSYRKHNYFNIPIKDGILSIPVAQVYRSYYALGAGVYDLAHGFTDEETFKRDMIESFAQSFSPVMVDERVGSDYDNTLMNTLINNVALLAPIYDVAVNKNYLGMPIYKVAPFLNEYDSQLQYQLNTTPSAIGNILYSIQKAYGADSKRTTVREDFTPYSSLLNINPSILDYYIKYYSGWAGDMFITMIDDMARMLNDQYEKEFMLKNFGKPINSFASVPVLKDFIISKNNVLDYYTYNKAMEFHDIVQSRLNALKKDIRIDDIINLLDNNMELVFAYQKIDGLSERIKNNYSSLNKIYDYMKSDKFNKENYPMYENFIKMLNIAINDDKNMIVDEFNKIKKIWLK